MKGYWLPVCLAFGAIWLLGQNPYGRIGGRVTDSAGAVVPGASVKVMHVETGVETQALANEEGYYEAANLSPGLYRVVAEMRASSATSVRVSRSAWATPSTSRSPWKSDK